jgi:hypothetical protein
MNRITARPGIKQFADVQIGETFRGLRPDPNPPIAMQEKGYKPVPSDGLYVKVGNCVAVDIAHNNKDCVFSLKLMCRVLPRVFDVTHLDTYIVNNRNKPR